MKCNRIFKQGWRQFNCQSCDRQFQLPTRDHTSPSVECCPYCNAEVRPRQNWADPNLPVDDWGNLIK